MLSSGYIVKIINLTEDKIVIPCHTMLAKAENVHAIFEAQCKSSAEEKEQMTPEEHSNLAKDRKLFREEDFDVAKEISEDMRENVYELLFSYANCFVLDLERPGNVKKKKSLIRS